MINLKSEKGSITVFVLASCMFFIAAVTCMQMYMQSKQIAVDREYRQIKANYEKDIENIDDIYNGLQKIQNADVKFTNVNLNRYTKKITTKILLNTEDMDISTLKYGWIYSEDELESYSQNDITEWTYVENANGSNEIQVNKSNIEDTGYYYLCFMVNDKEKWMKINDYITDGLIIQYDAMNNTKTGHNSKATVWEDYSGNDNDATLTDFENTSESGWLDNGLICNGESNNFKTADVNLEENSDLTVSITFTENKFVEYKTGTGNLSILRDNNAIWKSFTFHTYYSNYSTKMSDGTVYIGGNYASGGYSNRFTPSELSGYKTQEGKTDNVTYVYNGTTRKATVYINSVEIASKIYTVNPEAIQFFKSGTGNFKTYHNILIYNRALTDAEVKTNYDMDNLRYNIEE